MRLDSDDIRTQNFAPLCPGNTGPDGAHFPGANGRRDPCFMYATECKTSRLQPDDGEPVGPSIFGSGSLSMPGKRPFANEKNLAPWRCRDRSTDLNLPCR